MTRIFSFILLMMGAICFFSGCASIISEEILRRSERDFLFDEFHRNPEVYSGTIVLLGGTVLRVFEVDHEIRVEVLERSLGWRLKPGLDDRTQGRFLIIPDSFQPEAAYQKGHKITVAGEVLGSELHPLQFSRYKYILLRAIEIHSWQEDAFHFGGFHLNIGLSGSL